MGVFLCSAPRSTVLPRSSVHWVGACSWPSICAGARSPRRDDDLLLLQLRERRGSLRVKIHHEGENEVVKKLPVTDTSCDSFGEYNRTRQEDSKPTLNLTHREIQVLCWERGLLRSALDKQETRGKDEECGDRHSTANALLSRQVTRTT